jgi:hypothetical protein
MQEDHHLLDCSSSSHALDLGRYVISEGAPYGADGDKGLFTAQVLYTDRTTEISQASSTQYHLRVVMVVVGTLTSFTIAPN